jgi:hypothetical protein
MGRNSPQGIRRSLFDRLESRQLLASINVTSFGARPNDGGDDLGAIRAAINASANGDTIYFPSGTYNLSDQVFLKGSRNYLGDNATLHGNDNNRHVLHIQQDNTKVEGFTIEGKPIMIDTGSGAMVAGVVINNNTIRNTGTGSDNSAITFTTGLRNSTISNNTFDSIGPMGIYGYYWDGLTISNNEFMNGGQGMHVDDHSNNSRNLTIEQNLFSGIRRMGVEYQGGGWNTILQDNWYEKPVMTSNFHDNDATFAFSIVADRSNGTIARRNVIWAPERPDGVGVRIGFETGGDGSLVEDNYVYGLNQVLANTDGAGTTSITARNNHYHQVLDGLVGRGLTQYNNGPNVNKDWLINRGKPGRNKRFTDPGNPNGGTQTSGNTTSTPSNPTTSVPAPSGATFLSDLNWASATNGWGAVEKDRSNGETGTGDGRTITLNGATYSKGLGVHSNSEIVYNLNGQYKQFLSDVGVDDEVGNNGSLAFEVYVDGTLAYDSGTMNGSTGTKSLTVDVSGKNQLKLVMHPDGNGNAYDHGDWANARLIANDGATTASTPPSGGTWLSDLNWTSANNGWGAVEKDKSNGEQGSNDGRTLKIGGTSYSDGLGVHSASDVRFNLGGKYKTFQSDIGIDEEVGNNGSVTFQVYLDGKLAYDSGTMRGSDGAKQINLALNGANELRLVVTTAGDGNTFDHADWAGAKVLA